MNITSASTDEEYNEVIKLNLNEHKIKESEIIKIPAYIKIIKLRKTIGSFVGLIAIMSIIGQFLIRSFWDSVLMFLIIMVFWFVINLILNLIFNPIITSLLKDFEK